MKKIITIEGRQTTYYSTNLCSYGEKGDYELFPSEEQKLDMIKLKDRLLLFTSVKGSNLAVQFIYADTKVTIYEEGRLLLLGVTPDTHEQAFEILLRILNLSDK